MGVKDFELGDERIEEFCGLNDGKRGRNGDSLTNKISPHTKFEVVNIVQSVLTRRSKRGEVIESGLNIRKHYRCRQKARLDVADDRSSAKDQIGRVTFEIVTSAFQYLAILEH